MDQLEKVKQIRGMLWEHNTQNLVTSCTWSSVQEHSGMVSSFLTCSYENIFFSDGKNLGTGTRESQLPFWTLKVFQRQTCRDINYGIQKVSTGMKHKCEELIIQIRG